MVRSALVFLLVLMVASSVAARDRRRSRRSPSSASPPPVDYEAIRAAVRAALCPRVEAWLKTRIGKLEISAGEIDEIRVSGGGQALVFVRTRPPGDREGPWRPDVSLWIHSGGAWGVTDYLPGSPPPGAGGGRFPSRYLDRPRHAEGAVDSLAKMARVLAPGRSRRDGRVDLVVRCLGPGARRRTVFNAAGRIGGRIRLQQKELPLREGECGDKSTQQRLIETLLNDLLGKGLLPDQREYHLSGSGTALLATGFAPSRYLEEVALLADGEGRPVSIIRIQPGRHRSTRLQYVRKGGRSLISGWVRWEDGVRETCRIRWRPAGRGWLPAKVWIERPKGTFDVTFSST